MNKKDIDYISEISKNTDKNLVFLDVSNEEELITGDIDISLTLEKLENRK